MKTINENSYAEGRRLFEDRASLKDIVEEHLIEATTDEEIDVGASILIGFFDSMLDLMRGLSER